jgi:hypothetical protein
MTFRRPDPTPVVSPAQLEIDALRNVLIALVASQPHQEILISQAFIERAHDFDIKTETDGRIMRLWVEKAKHHG